MTHSGPHGWWEPRTAQTHLTHIYSKLNLSSRVQVVQEAARHIEPADLDR